MNYCVYAIYNRQHDKIYIGQTEDLEKRLEMHNLHTLGGYTSRYDGLWQIIYDEIVCTREEALKREKQLKSYRGREFIRNKIPW
jgi:putative endonuclease